MPQQLFLSRGHPHAEDLPLSVRSALPLRTQLILLSDRPPDRPELSALEMIDCAMMPCRG